MRKNPFGTFALQGKLLLLAILISLTLAPRASAFSLLGPYADWMVETNGYRQPGDIGGPVDLGEEYRWNVPVITYGFDKSFVDYFGSNGVAAVEEAIQIMNNLPAASDIVLTNYPTDTRRVNFQAVAVNVYDLKSTALALLIEQMGLGQPTRNVVDVPEEILPPPSVSTRLARRATEVPRSIGLSRNFDPETLEFSPVVNGTEYSTFLSTNGGIRDYVEFPIDPQEPTYSAVADAFSLWYSGLQPGMFYTGLTGDDAGGIRYLLSATNVNWESLDVMFTGNHSGANRRLRGTWRPGVEKITFVPHPQNKRGKFTTAVLKFTAYYTTNGLTLAQPAKRVVSQPDILFSVADTYNSGSPMFLRTGTSNWVNNARENFSRSSGAGPGVIVPPVKITFDKLGPEVSSDGINPAATINCGWASFDASTNPPVLYPQDIGQTNLAVRLHFFVNSSGTYNEFTNSLFNVPVSYGGLASLQTSTNNTDWSTLATVTNNGAVVRWDYYGTMTPISFRVIPGAQ